MATRIDVMKRNKAKRLFKKNLSLAIKILFGTIATLMLLTVVFVGMVYLYHQSNTKDDIKKLTDAGLYNIVELEDGRKMNAAICGDKNKDYIIVPIGGVGTYDFSVYSQYISNDIKNRVCLALIDRAGYGFSDDTTKKQTVEQIVNDYRECLLKTEIKKPYVLMAHDFGSVYATYWSSMYPDEIKGIIYLDGTIISNKTEIKTYKGTKEDKYLTMMCKIGFQRMFYGNDYNSYSKVLNSKEVECAKALGIHSVKTNAQLSELKLMEQNLNTTLDAMKQNNIPKLYLSASGGFTNSEEAIEYFEYKNKQNEVVGKDTFFDFDREESAKQKEMQEFINQSVLKYEEVISFADELGNCKVARIPGDVNIHEQKAEGITDAIIDFAWLLQGQDKIKDVYKDTKAESWENLNKK